MSSCVNTRGIPSAWHVLMYTGERGRPYLRQGVPYLRQGVSYQPGVSYLRQGVPTSAWGPYLSPRVHYLSHGGPLPQTRWSPTSAMGYPTSYVGGPLPQPILWDGIHPVNRVTIKLKTLPSHTLCVQVVNSFLLEN